MRFLPRPRDALTKNLRKPEIVHVFVVSGSANHIGVPLGDQASQVPLRCSPDASQIPFKYCHNM